VTDPIYFDGDPISRRVYEREFGGTSRAGGELRSLVERYIDQLEAYEHPKHFVRFARAAAADLRAMLDQTA
jgi:hypothetical protein